MATEAPLSTTSSVVAEPDLLAHDPALVEDTRAWLTKAQMDLRAGDLLLSAAPPLLGGVVFHSQQAAEKAMKAFLAWHDEPFRKTHNLEEVGR